MLLRLQVREETDFLEGFGGQVLRLIHHQDHPLARFILLDKEPVEDVEQRRLVQALDRQVELLAHELEELRGRNHRVVDDADLDLLGQVAQQQVDQGRLARADLPGDHHEPLLLLDRTRCTVNGSRPS